MGNNLEYKVILGSERYKSASNTNLGFKVPLVQNGREITEFDRSVDISLGQVYDDERQSSSIFRPATKFSIIFKNGIAGRTNYPPFKNNLYYLNELADTIAQCSDTNYSWLGLPQYNEFDFIRSDYNVPGYTQAPNQHLTFISQSASTYNWNFFLSYPYENDYNKTLQALDKYGYTHTWVASSGIPFVIVNSSYNGQNIISFKCPVKHNLSVGEFVELTISYNGENIFQVYSLGDGKVNSSEYIFNLSNIGYSGSTFNTGVQGTFKRIIDINDTGDTKSEYYVRRNKIITNVEDAILVKAGFELNGFNLKRKFLSSGLTPNNVSRVAIKEGGQSYSLSFNRDIDISTYKDNQKRPISELFFTTIWKGYFGWSLGTPSTGIAGPGDGLSGHFNGLKEGWEFNLPPLSNGQPNPWWAINNSNSNTNYNINYYTVPGAFYPSTINLIKFTYVESLTSGTTIDGDFCEWNNFEQKERIISENYHKFYLNPMIYQISGTTSLLNPLGYYYKPNYPIKLRVYSDYIEEAKKGEVDNVPDYSYYSNLTNTFRWRDIYTYGYIDSSGNGVDYPFLNGKHYPYINSIFRLIPEGTNYIENNFVSQPTIDGCE